MTTPNVTIPFTYLKNVLPYVKGTIYENKINEYLIDVKGNLDYLNNLNKTHKYSVTEITVPITFIKGLCQEIRYSLRKESLKIFFKDKDHLQIEYKDYKEYKIIEDYLNNLDYKFTFHLNRSITDYKYFIVHKNKVNNKFISFEQYLNMDLPCISVSVISSLIKKEKENG